jgi:hypothetical protein
MRAVLIAFDVIGPLAAAPVPADAQPRPWCLRTGSDGPTGGLDDCSYQTLAQCRASMGGPSDRCLENPALMWDRREGGHAQPPPRKRGN